MVINDGEGMIAHGGGERQLVIALSLTDIGVVDVPEQGRFGVAADGLHDYFLGLAAEGTGQDYRRTMFGRDDAELLFATSLTVRP